MDRNPASRWAAFIAHMADDLNTPAAITALASLTEETWPPDGCAIPLRYADVPVSQPSAVIPSNEALDNLRKSYAAHIVVQEFSPAPEQHRRIAK